MRLPDGWRSATLAEIARWGSGGTPKAGTPEYYDGDIPWAVIGDLSDGPIGATTNHITAAGLAASSAKRVPAGAVLVAMYGSIGKLGLTTAELTTNQAIAFAVPDPEVVEARFLFYYLLSQRDRLTAAGKGAAQRNIGQGTLKPWPIPLPRLAEQRQIVELLDGHLSRLDAAQAGAERGLRRLDSLEGSVLAQCYLLGQRVALGELATIQGGIQKQPKRAPAGNSAPFLRVANVTARGLDLEEVHRVELFDGELGKLRLEGGDLLVVEGNGSPSQIGRAALWNGEIANCVHQNHLIRVRPGPRLDPAYLEAIWNAPQNRRELTGLASSSSGLHTLSVGKLKKLLVPVVDADTQSHVSFRVGEYGWHDNAYKRN